MRFLQLFAAVAPLLLVALPAQTSADAPHPTADRRPAWTYLDVPLWDISNEGLLFRFTWAMASDRDVITRVLFASEARWTLSAGYAKVYNSYDGATGIFKNPGGHALLLSAGRQMYWDLPPVAGAFTPRIMFEYGIHVASRRFPADGTHANFKVLSGLEWALASKGEPNGWTAGVFWPHFSNANLFSRNSGYDGLAIRIGRSVRF
jgi:hypothetical protein